MKKKPDWLKIRVKTNVEYKYVEKLLSELNLNTVCEEANCPNKFECFSKKTATFMVLGRHCTRNCTYCNVLKSTPDPVDECEPKHIADACNKLGLRHVVITSVTRDDLEDGGSGHFADIINEIRTSNKEIIIEVLIPDFKGNLNSLKKVISAKPDIINHNVETVPRLYPTVRPMANYMQSLKLLKNVKSIDQNIKTKSGRMVGLGETFEEVTKTFKDLRESLCDFLTVGQYLAPSNMHHPVIEYINPEIFKKYKEVAEEIGFSYVASAPLVRSSYQAEKAMENLI
jgi:lipoic acid synthetase